MRALLAGLCFFFMHSLPAQQAWRMDEIVVSGNDHTKERVILRELNVHPGDTIYDWDQFNIESRNNLLNTGLFNEVRISRMPDAHVLQVEVKESLFLLPIPFINLADRNFNEWWVTHQHDLKRLNFGLNLYHINLTGRNDKLQLAAQLGFIQKFVMAYEFPYLGRQMQLQPYTELVYARQQEVPYITKENRQIWFSNEHEILLERYRITLGLRYRPNVRTSYAFESSYFQNRIGEEIRTLNPSFLNTPGTDQRYFQFRFIYDADFRNRPVYPTEGYKIQWSATANGLSESLNTFYLGTHMAYWHPWTKRLSGGVQIQARKYLFDREIPFFQSRALGYEDHFVRSYEYFVVDGPDFILAKSDLKLNLFSEKVNWGPIMFIRQLREMPFRIFTDVFLDAGKVRPLPGNQSNFLDHDWLIGYGAGLDVLVYQNFLFRIQYSRGIHNNGGFFIHFSTNY